MLSSKDGIDFLMILISDGWWELWGTTSQWVMPIDVSDHCSIILR